MGQQCLASPLRTPVWSVTLLRILRLIEMLRVSRLSGQELAVVTVTDLETVNTLKEHLTFLYDCPECMQQLVLADCSLDDGVELTAPVDLQLVLAPAPIPVSASGEVVHLLVRAPERGNVEAIRLLLFEPRLSKGFKPWATQLSFLHATQGTQRLCALYSPHSGKRQGSC